MKVKLLKKVRKRVKIFYNQQTKKYDISVKYPHIGWIWVRGYSKEDIYIVYRAMIKEVCKTQFHMESKRLYEIKHAEK